MPTEIIVALIVAGFGFLGTLIEVSRRQNNRDHGVTSGKIDELARGHWRMERKIDDLSDKHLEHIRDHAKGEL